MPDRSADDLAFERDRILKRDSPEHVESRIEPPRIAIADGERDMARIESGQLPLNQMLAGYQRGAALLAFCRQRLEAVQDQIKVLDEGQLQPWSQE